MNAHTQPCEYELCNCVVSGEIEGASYCSDICRSRDGQNEEMESGCECGHSPCDSE